PKRPRVQKNHKLKFQPECVDTTTECVDTPSQLRKKGLLETGSSVDTTRDCVDTLSQSGNWVSWELGLVSTLPGLNTTCVSYVHLLTTEEPLAQVQYKLEHDDSDLFEIYNLKKPKR
ncbi:hypothetical protein Taro_046457, partial [Colocasia esculenta]|nr:hypothetical protein [Colocasia esculenta]